MKKYAAIGAVILAVFVSIYIGSKRAHMGPGENPSGGLKPYLGGLAFQDNEGWIYPDGVDEDYNATTKERAALKYVEEINRKDTLKFGGPRIEKFRLKEVDQTKLLNEFVGTPGKKETVMEYVNANSGKNHRTIINKSILNFSKDKNGNLYVSGTN